MVNTYRLRCHLEALQKSKRSHRTNFILVTVIHSAGFRSAFLKYRQRRSAHFADIKYLPSLDPPQEHALQGGWRQDRRAVRVRREWQPA